MRAFRCLRKWAGRLLWAHPRSSKGHRRGQRGEQFHVRHLFVWAYRGSVVNPCRICAHGRPSSLGNQPCALLITHSSRAQLLYLITGHPNKGWKWRSLRRQSESLPQRFLNRYWLPDGERSLAWRARLNTATDAFEGSGKSERVSIAPAEFSSDDSVTRRIPRVIQANVGALKGEMVA